MTNLRVYCFVLCASVLWQACQQQVEQPSLSDDTVVRIMADLYVAEAATTGLGGFKKDSLTFAYYEQVFEIHGVAREEYEKNLRLIARDEYRMEELTQAATALLQPKDAEKERED